MSEPILRQSRSFRRIVKMEGSERAYWSTEKIFSNENLFTIERKFNKQNNQVYARSVQEASHLVERVQRGHHSSSVLVWWEVSNDKITKLHFCERG
jgi:hypothetical protein